MNQRIILKEYNQHQPILLPPIYDELIPANHSILILNTINQIKDALKGKNVDKKL